MIWPMLCRVSPHGLEIKIMILLSASLLRISFESFEDYVLCRILILLIFDCTISFEIMQGKIVDTYTGHNIFRVGWIQAVFPTAAPSHIAMALCDEKLFRCLVDKVDC